MAHARGALSALVALGALLALAVLADAATVTKVSPSIGSVHGGQMITIFGTGFSRDLYEGNNEVLIGPNNIPCVVNWYYATTEMIVCETVRYPDTNWLSVRVLVDGIIYSTCTGQCQFRYHSSYTPWVNQVQSRQVREGSVIRIDGQMRMSNIDLLREVKIGDRQCQFIDDGGDAFAFDVYSSDWNRVDCLIGDNVQNTYNVTARTNLGFTSGTTNAYLIDKFQRPYMVEDMGEIRKVRQTTSTSAGGALVTITGRGFDPDVTVVRVGDGECAVATASWDEITCRAPAQAVSATGYYQGGRGVRFGFYSGVSSLDALASTTLTPSRTYLADSFYGEVNVADGYGTIGRAYFTAPWDSLYTFYMGADDYFELWMTYGMNASAPLTRLFRQNGYCSVDSYCRSSSPMYLSAGQVVYLESRQVEFNGGDWSGVGVKIHNVSYPNSKISTVQAERDRVWVQADMTEEMHSVTVSNAPNTSASTFTLAFGGRTTAPMSVAANASTVAGAVSALFRPQCTITDDGGAAYDLDTFETAADDWSSRNSNDPVVVSDTSYCGAKSLFMGDTNSGPSWGRNFEGSTHEAGQSDSGYLVRAYPYMCMAYRIQPGTPVYLLVYLSDVNGWRWITFNVRRSDEVATFAPITDDAQWHYTCIDLQSQLEASIGVSSSRMISAVIWYGAGEMSGSFHIDEFFIGQRPRVISRVAPPTAPNDITSVSVALETLSATSRRYNITFNTFECTAGPYALFTAAVSGGDGASVAVTRANERSAPLAGSVAIEFRNRSITVGAGISRWDMDRALESLGTTGALTVYRYGGCRTGWYYDVYFLDIPGDIDGQLRIVPESLQSLSGLNARASVQVITPGGLLLTPIPGQFLRTVETSPQITVETNGFDAACDAGSCSFTYKDNNAPTLSGVVTPSSASYGTTITISGSKLRSNDPIEVSLQGGSFCTVTAFSNPAIECTVPLLPFGTHSLRVWNYKDGYALGTASVVSPITITSVTPLSVAPTGGARVTIAGSGLPASASRANVTIGGAACALVSCAADRIVCTAPALAAGAYSVSVTAVGVHNASEASTVEYGASQITVDDALTPGLVAVSRASTPTYGTDLIELSGARLLAAGATSAAGVHVRIGATECAIESASDALIACRTQSSPAGAFELTLVDDARGAANASFAFVVAYEIQSVHPNVGALGGQQTITVDGSGFRSGIHVSIFLQRATILTLSDTRMTITTPAHSASYPVEVVSALDDAHIARCAGDLVANCSFSYEYSDALTATAEDVAPYRVFAGEMTNITGHGFAYGATSIKFGGLECAPELFNDTLWRCAVDASLEPGVYTPTLRNEFGVGVASTRLTVVPRIDALESAQSGFAGGALVTLRGAGFGTSSAARASASLAFGAQACRIVSHAADAIVCETGAVTGANAQTAVDFTAAAALSINGIAANCTNATSLCRVAYRNASTPYVAAITPATGLVSGATITLRGERLGSTALTAVYVRDTRATAGTPAAAELVCNVVGVYNASRIECTLPSVRASTYAVRVRVDGVGDASGTTSSRTLPSLTMPLQIASVSPTSGSLYGGQTVTLTGAGFATLAEQIDSSIAVVVWLAAGAAKCANITAATRTQLVCVTASLSAGAASAGASGAVTMTQHGGAVSSACTGACSYQFTSSVTPTLSVALPNSGSGGQTVSIIGSNFGTDASAVSATIGGQACAVSSVSDSTVVCTAPALTSGAYAVSVLRASWGYSNAYQSFTYTLVAAGMTPSSGSFGGGITVTLAGSGFASGAANVNVSLCGVRATVVAASPLSLVFVVPAQSAATFGTGSSALSCAASIASRSSTGASATTTSTGSFTYQPAMTARLVRVQPQRGSTAGGTRVTLSGAGFGAAQGAQSVELNAGVPCAVQSWSDTAVVCTSGAYAYSDAARPVRLLHPTNGAALLTPPSAAEPQAGYYHYVDLWSRNTTWGGQAPPRDGEGVWVPQNQTVMLDVSTARLTVLILEGALVADPSAEHLRVDAEYVVINHGGALQVGTEAQPHAGNFTLTLHGHRRSPELPIYGSKVLAVHGGTLDLHGLRKVPTWTRLERDAAINDTLLQLAASVNWAVGDYVVVASSSQAKEEAELATIVWTNGTHIELDTPLAFAHLGSYHRFGNATFDLRTEVAVLSRNVVVQGDLTSAAALFGSTIMMHSSERQGHPASMRIESVEVRNAGQAFGFARYSMHFHLSGSRPESYIRYCGIHHTYNRALTVHGTHGVDIRGNVAYDVMGHTFFIEDGNEVNNTFEYNIGLMTRPSNSLLNTDQTPATFWITNPSNYIRHNVAAGSDKYGFWLRFLEHPEGPSFSTDVCPMHMPLGAFENNTAHSNGRYGVRVYPQFFPLARPCDPASPSVPATLRNVTSYMNVKNGLTATEIGNVQFEDFKCADNTQAGFEVSFTLDAQFGAAQVRNSVVVSNTFLGNITSGAMGVWTGASHGLHVENITFVNFNEPHQSAFVACSHCKDIQGGFEQTLRGIRYHNSTRYVRSRWEHEFIYNDLDGSASRTGVPNAQIVPTYALLYVPECSRPDGFDATTVCTNALKFRRTLLNGVAPNTVDHQLLYFRWRGLTGSVRWSNYNDNGYMHIVPLGQSLEWGFDKLADWTNLHLRSNFAVTPNANGFAETYEVMTHQLQRYEYFRMSPGASVAAANLTAYDASTARVPYWVNRTTAYHAMGAFRALAFGMRMRVREPDLTVVPRECPDAGCPAPPPPPPFNPNNTLYWSNAKIWPNETLPRAGDNVEVPADWDLVLDTRTPVLNNVTVLGQLRFADRAGVELHARIVLVWGGRIRAGNATHPHRAPLSIVLYGTKTSPQLNLNNVVIPGAKVIAVFGALELYGAPRTCSWTRLGATAAAGARTIVLSDVACDIGAGDRLVLASTDFDPYHAEEVEVAARINATHVQLSAPLAYTHFGERLAYGARAIDMRGEIGVLTRSIVVSGGNTSEADQFGARIYVAQIASGKQTLRGSFILDNIEMRYAGQDGVNRPALEVDNLGLANESLVHACVFDHGYYTQVYVAGSGGLPVVDNVAYDSWDTTFYVRRGWPRANLVQRNLGVLTRFVETGRKDFRIDLATFRIDVDNVFTDNAAAGSDRMGVNAPFDSCGGANAAAPTEQFRRNSAHSSLIGFRLLGDRSDCALLANITAYSNWDFGAFGYLERQSLRIEHASFADNKRHAMLSHSHGAGNFFLTSDTIAYSDVLMVGVSPNSQCTQRAPPNNMGMIGSAYGEPFYGLWTSTFAKCVKHGPPYPWQKIHCYPGVRGVVNLDGVTFAEWHEDACGRRAYAISNNQISPDATHPHLFRNVEWINSERDSYARIYDPDPAWINEEDCVDMDCDGPKHVLLKDLDGTLLGHASTPARGAAILARTEHNFTYTQLPPLMLTLNNGTRIAPSAVYNYPGAYRGYRGECELRNETWNAYDCQGLDYYMFVIESNDADTETRRLSPTALSTGGYTDLLNGPMDHGWCFGYTCLERLSTFFSIAVANRNYTIDFTSTNPETLRLHLLNAAASKGLRVSLFYAHPQKLEVEFMGTTVPEFNDRLPTLADRSGSNYFDRATKTLHLVLHGDGWVRIVTRKLIQVSLTLAVSVNEFYAENFVSNLAFVLRIDPSLIRIVDVRPGSVVVDFEIHSPSTAQTTTVDETTGEVTVDTSSDVAIASIGTTLIAVASNGSLSTALGTQVASVTMTLPPATPTSSNSSSSSSGGSSSGGGSGSGSNTTISSNDPIIIVPPTYNPNGQGSGPTPPADGTTTPSIGLDNPIVLAVSLASAGAVIVIVVAVVASYCVRARRRRRMVGDSGLAFTALNQSDSARRGAAGDEWARRLSARSSNSLYSMPSQPGTPKSTEELLAGSPLPPSHIPDSLTMGVMWEEEAESDLSAAALKHHQH